MVDSAHFVKSKSTSLRAFTESLHHFADMLQTYWRYAWRSLMLKKCFFYKLTGFLTCHFRKTAPSKLWLIVHTLWNQLLLELSLDLFKTLQICYRHIEDEHEEVWWWKNIFWQTYRVFNLAILRWPIVHTLWNHLLLKLLLDLFNTLQICYRHIEDVHEEVWCWKNTFLTNFLGF